jgi:ribosomal protein RSM22 (predicted rRNA methylase)
VKPAGERNRRNARAGSRIHQGLVGDRALIGTRYLEDEALRREYEAEIAPRTRLALAKILNEVGPGPRLGRPMRVLDLGAGTGAAGAAVRAFYGERDVMVEIVSVDRVAAPNVVPADLAEADVPAGVFGRFDLVVAAHVLNELFVDRAPAARIAARARKVRAWCTQLLDDSGEQPGTLILLEPALRETSRMLLEVRDQLVAAGHHVVAPCFWSGPCPALVRERDWCHDTVPAGADRAAHPRVDFSYLVLRNQGETASDPTVFRVVSDPMLEKGRLRLYGCGPSGRQALVRLSRHRSPANAAFDALRRGDVARVARTTYARDGLRITDETTVSV